MPLKPPGHRRNGRNASSPMAPSDTPAAPGHTGRWARRVLFLTPFLPGCYLQADPDDPELYPAIRDCAREMVETFALLQRCGFEERRARIAASPAPGLTFGPLALPYAPVFSQLARATARLEHETYAACAWDFGDRRRHEHNLQTLAELTHQASMMLAALYVHCADASDVPPDFALERLAEAEQVLNSLRLP